MSALDSAGFRGSAITRASTTTASLPCLTPPNSPANTLCKPLGLTLVSPTPTRPGTASKTTPITSSASLPRARTLSPASSSRRLTTRFAPTNGSPSGTSNARVAPSPLLWSLDMYAL